MTAAFVFVGFHSGAAAKKQHDRVSIRPAHASTMVLAAHFVKKQLRTAQMSREHNITIWQTTHHAPVLPQDQMQTAQKSSLHPAQMAITRTESTRKQHKAANCCSSSGSLMRAAAVGSSRTGVVDTKSRVWPMRRQHRLRRSRSGASTAGNAALLCLRDTWHVASASITRH